LSNDAPQLREKELERDKEKYFIAHLVYIRFWVIAIFFQITEDTDITDKYFSTIQLFNLNLDRSRARNGVRA
jgi:hypothetical protein